MVERNPDHSPRRILFLPPNLLLRKNRIVPTYRLRIDCKSSSSPHPRCSGLPCRCARGNLPSIHSRPIHLHVRDIRWFICAYSPLSVRCRSLHGSGLLATAPQFNWQQMGKSTKDEIGSRSSCSKSVFAKALKVVRHKFALQHPQSSGTKRSSSLNLSGTKARTGKVYSRCSPGIITDIVNGLDQQRIDILSEMGFEGFAAMKIEKTNRQFGAWLLSRFDPISGSFNAGTKSELKLTCQDINLILGIPCKGKDIVPATQQEVITMKKYLCHVFEKQSFDQINIHTLCRILYRSPQGRMNADEIVQFKTAFIILVVTKFLAPVSLNNYISSRYMKALVDIDNIHNYNWAKFVLDELKIAASSLQNKLQQNKGAGYINGCIILLQLFYLDNLDIGSNTPRHDCFPRIRSYDDKMLAELAKQDMVLQKRFPFHSFGKLRLRDRRHTCYMNQTVASTIQTPAPVQQGLAPRPIYRSIQGIDPPSFDLGLSQQDSPPVMGESNHKYKRPAPVQQGSTPKPIYSSIQGIDPPSFDLGLSQQDSPPVMGESNHKYKTPAPVQQGLAPRPIYRSIQGIDPPSFDLGLSQPDSPPVLGESNRKDKQIPAPIDHGLTPRLTYRSTECIDPPSFDLVLSQPDSPSILGELNPKDIVHANLDVVFAEAANTEVVPDTPPSRQGLSSSGNKEKIAAYTSPHSILKEVNGVRIHYREQFSVTQFPPKSRRRIIGEPADLLVDRPMRAIKPSKVVKSPFLCKQHPITRHDSKAVDDLFRYTVSNHEGDSLNKIWVHISNPIPMTLKLNDIQQVLDTNQPMPEETFNVAVQVLHEDELHKFGSTEFVGWRHFLNQDFAMYAIAGTDHWDPADHIHYFTDETLVPYDVSACRLIFIPVHHVAHYTLYAFDMEKKTVSILDPVRDTSLLGKDIEVHHSNTKRQVSIALQDCLKLAFPFWNEDILSWGTHYPTSILPGSNEVDSAFLVLNYMKNWDGTRLVNRVPMDSHTMRKEYLMNLLSFKTNEAILPETVKGFIQSASRR